MFVVGGLADNRKQPCLETGFSIENSFSAENFYVNELKHVLGFVRPSPAAAQRPPVAFDMVRFKSVAQPGVVEGQSSDIGPFSHVARSFDRLGSYAEHEQCSLSSWRLQKSQRPCLQGGR